MSRISCISAAVCFCTFLIGASVAQDIIGCGGFVKSEVEINFSLIEVKLYTKQGSLKYQTDCAPNNGYYMIPVYDKGDYVLKVEPPPGWTFDPVSVELAIDGQNDKCSKNEDINFQFTGFGVVGKVISKGEKDGPAGVTFKLKKSGSSEAIKETTSVTGGGYTFENVLPGEYNIEASHPHWKFEKNAASVKVVRETGNAGSEIAVLGYDVKGEVLSEGEPIPGVNFILSSNTVKRKDIKDCNEAKVKGYPDQDPPALCHVVSQKDGSFVFPALPCGTYNLVPFYRGELTTFDVVPSKLEFTVNHESVKIPEAFKVAGFSVSGRVLSTKGGSGVIDAAVILNNKEQTRTKSDGTFHLDSMKAGSYSLDIRADRMGFDTTTVKISPNAPQLADVVAARFSACGQVVIDKFPEGQGSISPIREVKVTAKGKDSSKTVRTDNQGHFCADIEPGTYIFQVMISNSEAAAGLRLAPTDKEVVVKDKPVDGIRFSQFRAQVSGTINCLEKCGVFHLSLASMSRSSDRQLSEAIPSGNTAKFTFNDIMPGKYRVSLQHEDWCWAEKALELEVVEQDVTNLVFKQTGYVLSCTVSHDIKLNYAQDTKGGSTGSFDLQKGQNKFCLDKPGAYNLNPVSCHQFDQDSYKYDTSSSSMLTLAAVKHQVEGVIVTQDLQTDIVVTITSSLGEKPTTLGPLVSDKEPTKKQKSPPKGPFNYVFTHWAKNDEKLTITAESKQLLFYPDDIDVTIQGEKCPGLVAKFEGKQGVFVEGKIQPALADVSIAISPDNNPDKVIKMTSDANGAFRVGPLHGDTEYSVNTEKDGYVLTPIDGKKYHFKAFKLGEIKIMVEDEEGRMLPGVLLSLTGGGSGSSYRSNKISEDDGAMDFSSLSPGQYFLRPMMKEYRFDPVSQMIDVTEGSTSKIKIKGIRVAFSCYGSVTSLNGEPESDVFVEAVGIAGGECANLQEESKTEADGSYRIRGLQPNCDYDIRLKSGNQLNVHIERSAPKVRRVKVVSEDLASVNIIAFRRMNQMDISGNVITQLEHLNSLKILLYKESNMDSPIQTVSLGATSFFYTSALKIDHQEYVIRLDSNLPRNQYDYTLPEILFRANASYRHFTFTFNPERKTVEQELSQSSLLALPLAIVVIIIGYNYKKLLPILSQGGGVLQGILSAPRGHSQQSHNPNYPLEINPDLLSEPSGQSKRKAKLRKT